MRRRRGKGWQGTRKRPGGGEQGGFFPNFWLWVVLASFLINFLESGILKTDVLVAAAGWRLGVAA